MAAVLLCFSTLFMHSNAHAQGAFFCPDSTVPYLGPDWSGPFNSPVEYIEGTSCGVIVIFCVRMEISGGDTTPDYYIDAVNPVDSATCAIDFSPLQIILGGIAMFEADTSIIESGSGGFAIHVPYCVGGSFQPVKFTINFCWEQVIPPIWVLPPQYLPCVSDPSYCVTSCELCRNVSTGKMEETDCSSSGTFEGPCATIPPDGAWINGVCYDINPCSH
jgi:hypothetical protein